MHEKESRAIRLGYIQDAWDADDPTGWQLAVKYLYGKHKIVIARSWQPQQQQPQEQEPHPEPCCTAVSLSLPAVGTVSSLLRAAKAASGACGTPVVIEDQPLLCYGGGGSLFSASPCPVSAWNDFSAFGKVLANAGRLSNVNPLPEDLPLPDVEVPAVATTEAVSKAGAKAGKKK
ncbi:hypothetical protein DIPPA_10836 [Diplonema papillatum]|nr:hypothetical protein DIPPA_10836 [Diplonema papillatum]